MVGPPKTLHDLRRVEAQVRVTCVSCKATELWELDALIAEVKKNGGNVDWRAARWSLKCPRHCPSPRIELLALPFGKQRARQRAQRHALLNVSLEILRDAAARSAEEPVGTLEVRLALHVLRLFLRDDQLLASYWTAATVEPRHPWTSCALPYRRIVEALIKHDAPVDAANRP